MSQEWLPMHLAREDGTPCDLKFRDVMGEYEGYAPFVLHAGRWYVIEPPCEVVPCVVAWRPAADSREDCR